MKKHKKEIRRCFDLGKLYQGLVQTNPLVGAVFIHADKIVGEGAHEQYGKAHAEVNALSNVHTDILRKGTLYVSLEPCFHQGKTPPCVNLILSKQIPKVAISCADPNPLVAGQSIQLMQNSGIQVINNILKSEGEVLIRPFVTGLTKKRPYIILKYAQSADGYLGYPDRQIWLTNTFSKHLVHKWRSESDAVLVGTNTAIIDNPQLTNRLFIGKKQNIRIVLDKTLKIPKHYHIYDNDCKTWILTAEEREDEKNIRYFKSNFEGNFLEKFLEELYQNQVGTILVEGGAKVLQSFIDANIWDEARVFHSPKILGKDATPAPKLCNAELQSTHQILDDVLNVYYKNSAF